MKNESVFNIPDTDNNELRRHTTTPENKDIAHLETDILEPKHLTAEQLFEKLTPIDDIELENIDIDAVLGADREQVLQKYQPKEESDDAYAESILDYIYDCCLDDFITLVSVSDLAHILSTNEEAVIKGFLYIHEHYRPLPFDIYFTADAMTIINRKLFSQYRPW